MDPAIVIVVLLAAGALIYLGIKVARAHAERERRRLAGLGRWGAANGFAFSPGDLFNLDGRYQGVASIGEGHDRYAFECLTRDAPVPSAIFRYHFKTWETRTVTRNGRTRTERYEATHWRRYLIVELGAAFPRLFLRTEGFLDRVAGFVGFDDIDFESEEFSRRYFCKSGDRQFAYAMIHPQMMEWLLSRRFEGEINQGLLVMDVSGEQHTPEGCQRVWEDATGFVNRIPDFVWQDYGKRRPVQLPQPSVVVSPGPGISVPLTTAAVER